MAPLVPPLLQVSQWITSTRLWIVLHDCSAQMAKRPAIGSCDLTGTLEELRQAAALALDFLSYARVAFPRAQLRILLQVCFCLKRRPMRVLRGP
jgi:hypothetical protein